MNEEDYPQPQMEAQQAVRASVGMLGATQGLGLQAKADGSAAPVLVCLSQLQHLIGVVEDKVNLMGQQLGPIRSAPVPRPEAPRQVVAGNGNEGGSVLVNDMNCLAQRVITVIDILEDIHSSLEV